jgi:uncharacterized protein YqjF (DUF2071 family)
VATHDGRAYVGVLALENVGIVPGSLSVPSLGRPFAQVNLRSYVEYGDTSGVYFHSLDSGDRLGATVGRRAFGLPFHGARSRVRRTGDTVRFSSRRQDDGPEAVFQARYRPDGPASTAEPGSHEAFCVERFRYLLPGGEAASGLPGVAPDDVVVGRIEREDWTLQPVDATLRTNTLFEAAGLPVPAAEPEFRYSPGFEMAVRAPGTVE